MPDNDTKLIVGLGNPGRKYAGTRHNAGFRVIDQLAKLLQIKVNKRKFGGKFCQVDFAGKNLMLLKPQKYMNCSGQSVATVVGFYKLELCNLLVVLDDMDLEPGCIRIRSKGSAGGQKGLADIIEKLNSRDVNRLRIGIGHPANCGQNRLWRSDTDDAVDYVLSRPSGAEKKLLDSAIKTAAEASLFWVTEGIEAAMNEFNN